MTLNTKKNLAYLGAVGHLEKRKVGREFLRGQAHPGMVEMFKFEASYVEGVITPEPMEVK